MHNLSAGRCVSRTCRVVLRAKMRFAFLPAMALLICVPSGRAARQQKPSAKPGAAPAGNAQNGKKVFSTHGCYECHGLQGQGSRSTGAPHIGPPVLPYPAFAQYVRHPSNQMPPYPEKILSDQDMADIYAFLKTIPKPRPAKDIPLLNQ